VGGQGRGVKKAHQKKAMPGCRNKAVGGWGWEELHEKKPSNHHGAQINCKPKKGDPKHNHRGQDVTLRGWGRAKLTSKSAKKNRGIQKRDEGRGRSNQNTHDHKA